jgi:uncharacterized damage-inducible protein DinB
MVRLETVIDSWRTVRRDTAQAVREMPEAELDFKPVPELASFREIARHILDASQGLTGLMLAGVDNLATPEFRDRLKQHMSPLPEDISAARLADALSAQLEERLSALAQQPPEFYSKMMTRFDGQQVTNLEMLETVKDHELTHRSQLFVYLRLKGIVPPTTRRRQAKA